MTRGSDPAVGVFLAKVEAYLAARLGCPGLKVEAGEQVFGGISRQTWSIDISWDEPGAARRRSIILRLDPPSSLLESGRRVEYAMYRTFHANAAVPVPEPILIEDDPAPLGMPFFAVSKAEGTASQFAFLQPVFAEVGPKIARQSIEALGSVAACDYRSLGLEHVLPVPPGEKNWAVQLDHWTDSFHAHSPGPMPIVEAAIRRLRRNPPPVPQRLAIVHGDYHFGNWMFSPRGVEAIIDWELAHIGDPHEDLAWAMLDNWRSGSRPDLIMHYLTPEETIAVWEGAYGAPVDRAALEWWTLFSHVKACALWVKGASELERSDGPLVYAVAGWMQLSNQELRMARLLKEQAE